MNTEDTDITETMTEETTVRRRSPLEDSPPVRNSSEHPATAGADNELMTGRRPPGRESTRVGFAVLAAAFVLDMLLHIAVGAAVWYVTGRSPDAAVSPIVAGAAAGIAASFVHRTLLQRLFRTTAGKAMFGLRLRQADGAYPSLWGLVKQWLNGVLGTIGAAVQLLG
ncbi:RDD family protein [Nocardia asiatica]|uniref:RDD family protein n=1 Tax=Nocardia asiatica TaxID=209252 RepID=UPI002458D34A|nr:RDD family protein [Nocardia asiatica]